METIDFIQHITGTGVEAKDLTSLQLSLRALIIYIASLVLIRLGNKRIIGKSSAFDFILSIIIGSTMSRAINGSGPLWGTTIACLLLVALHWIFAALSVYSHRFGVLVKGRPRLLIKDGQIQQKTMRRSHISEHDLDEAARRKGKRLNIEEIQEAYLERNGNISIIPRQREPRIIDIQVEQGVQTVRIVL